MWGTVQHDGNVSKPFKILKGVKQVGVLAPTPEGTCIHELTENCSTPLV